MGVFVIRKQPNGNYNFIFTSRKGDAIFTSINCKQKDDCKVILQAIRNNLEIFTFTKKNPGKRKFLFRVSKGGFVLASSRVYTTELKLEKEVNYILTKAPRAEVLDFSEDEQLFAD
ncbi:hypothetical protein [Zhouia amylolytica]|uniref:DUF1508 domain-containing protein n=1 Tax=Zhouia amylolytica AD3 TaxID=1286632 RepID=W2UM03_9FLAO|nr:hypothetical protein [Zhouia amylolytica]ETN94342.1 hypothetical protein P278_22840 [Zhouia amylolytica AD3]MCQ0110428.1 DUF1508 domain-containing protein [Zhouia amylolytica]